MEKVFEAHIHHLRDIPLPKAIEIYKKEFAEAGVEGGCFLSVPHHESGGETDTDALQNLKMLYLKRAFGKNFYAFAALVHPKTYTDKQAVKRSFYAKWKNIFP